MTALCVCSRERLSREMEKEDIKCIERSKMWVLVSCGDHNRFSEWRQTFIHRGLQPLFWQPGVLVSCLVNSHCRKVAGWRQSQQNGGLGENHNQLDRLSGPRIHGPLCLPSFLGPLPCIPELIQNSHMTNARSIAECSRLNTVYNSTQGSQLKLVQVTSDSRAIPPYCKTQMAVLSLIVKCESSAQLWAPVFFHYSFATDRWWNMRALGWRLKVLYHIHIQCHHWKGFKWAGTS